MGFFWQSQFGSPINSGINASPFDYVWLVAMENISYSTWHGDTTNAPYINNTLMGLGVTFSAWACFSNYGLSLPNYLDASGGSNQGIIDDNNPPTNTTVEPSVFSLVEAAGKTWKEYQEGYAAVGTPQSSTLTDGDSSPYTEHHCPAMYYTAIRSTGTRAQKIDDFTRLTASADFSTTSLATTPQFAWITPSNDHNMHDGATVAIQVSNGDTELSTLIPLLRNSYAFQNRKCLIVVWWDEGNTGIDPAVILVGSASANVKVNLITSVVHTHPDILTTIEWALGLGSCGRRDSTGTRIGSEAFS